MVRALFALISLYFFILSANGDCTVSLTFETPPTICIPTCEITDDWVYSLSGLSFTSTSPSGSSIFLEVNETPLSVSQTGCTLNYNLTAFEPRSNCNGPLCAKVPNTTPQTLYAAGDTAESGFCSTCFDSTQCLVPTTPLFCETVTNGNAQSTSLGYHSGVSFSVTNSLTNDIKIQNWIPYVKQLTTAQTISVYRAVGTVSFTNFATNWVKLGTSTPFTNPSAGFVTLTGILPLEIPAGDNYGILIVGSSPNLIYTNGDPASFDYTGTDIFVTSSITTNSIESGVEANERNPGPATGNPVRSWFGKTVNCVYTAGANRVAPMQSQYIIE